MKRNVFVAIIALITVVGLCLSCPVAVTNADGDVLPSGVADADVGAAIDAYLAERSANHAAVATAVFRGDVDVYTRYFGYLDAAGTVPLQADSVLEWGSTTKLLVWVSVMQLSEAGRIDLDADIATYLPDGFLRNISHDLFPVNMLPDDVLPMLHVGDCSVTMRNLMNHNAGFEDYVGEMETTDEDVMSLGDFLAKYQPHQVNKPGDVVAYSNWGAALAGYVVECISGVPFWQYVHTHIFEPLGMAHSALNANLSDNEWVRARWTDYVSYTPTGELFTDNKYNIIPYPAGRCTSTLEDMVRFAKALLTRDARLMAADTFDTMYSGSLYYTGTDRARIAHGLLVDYEFAAPIYGHDGNTMGGSSRILLDLQNGVGMVVLTNQLGGSMYRTGMAEVVFGTTEWHVAVDGHYVPMRTAMVGLDGFYSLFLAYGHLHITSELADGMYINVLPDRLEISATDYKAWPSLIFYDVVSIAWMVCMAYALLTFLVRIGILVADVVKHRPILPNLLVACLSLVVVLPMLMLAGVGPIGSIVLFVLQWVSGVALIVLSTMREHENLRDLSARWRFGQSISMAVPMILTLMFALVWGFFVL